MGFINIYIESLYSQPRFFTCALRVVK